MSFVVKHSGNMPHGSFFDIFGPAFDCALMNATDDYPSKIYHPKVGLAGIVWSDGGFDKTFEYTEYERLSSS